MLELSMELIMFSNYDGVQKELINVIVLIVKHYLYAHRYTKTPPTFVVQCLVLLTIIKSRKRLLTVITNKLYFIRNGSPLLTCKYEITITLTRQIPISVRVATPFTQILLKLYVLYFFFFAPYIPFFLK